MSDSFNELVVKFEDARKQLEQLLASDGDPSAESVSEIDREISASFDAITSYRFSNNEELYSRILFLVMEIERLSIDNTLTQRICKILLSDLEHLKGTGAKSK